MDYHKYYVYEGLNTTGMGFNNFLPQAWRHSKTDFGNSLVVTVIAMGLTGHSSQLFNSFGQ